MKIVSVVGARPQFVKASPVSRELRGKHREILVHTGQHYDHCMSQAFFEELGMDQPDYNLRVGSASHGRQTGEMLARLEEVLVKERPDIVLVYGDTNSTLAGALAAAKLHIPVAHVEAGLRSFNQRMPEEINRVLTDHISTILFCPSKIAVENLEKEGFKNVVNHGELIPMQYFSENKKVEDIRLDKDNPLVINAGDVMYDIFLNVIKVAEERVKILKKLRFGNINYCLLTIHRAENTDNLETFNKILSFVNDKSVGKTVIFPMHPRTKKVYEKAKKEFTHNIKIIEPVSYFELLILLKNSSLVITDSGGIQKEAYWLEVPCITLRSETEWVETVQSGWNTLYKDYGGTNTQANGNRAYYGDGKAAQRIAKILHQYSWK